VAAATVVTVAGVSAGVAFAATPSSLTGGSGRPGGELSGRGGAPLAGGMSQAAVNGRGTRYQASRPDSHAAPAATPGQRASRDPARSRPATAKSSPAAHPAAKPSPSLHAAATVRPYEFYDSVLPGAMPAGHPIATYADGPHAVAASQVAGRQVLWIDVLGTDYAAQVLDVEPGTVDPAAAPVWAEHRLATYPRELAIIYTSLAEWPLVQADVASLPPQMRARIRWWIANPTGYPHVVPGAQATQWYWGSSYDISTALPTLTS
jgi:hypothetical protein